MRRIWAQYFEHVLNAKYVDKSNKNFVGDWQMTELGKLNEREISIEEVKEAVSEMKWGKAVLE